MAVPTVYDFAILKYETATPGTFAAICGIENVSVNEVAEVSEQRRRDCATPNTPGTQVLKIAGTSFTVTGSGLTNADQRVIIKTLLFAKKANYKLEYMSDNASAGGLLLGTDSFKAVMESRNMTLDQNGDSSFEISLKGEGALTYVANP